MTHDIELIQGDTDDIKVQILQDGKVVDLTDPSVSFIMTSDAGDKITIICLKGYTDKTTTPDTVYPATDGYLTLPFTEIETCNADEFIGQFKLAYDGFNRRWALGKYVTVKIWEAI